MPGNRRRKRTKKAPEFFASSDNDADERQATTAKSKTKKAPTTFNVDLHSEEEMPSPRPKSGELHGSKKTERTRTFDLCSLSSDDDFDISRENRRKRIKKASNDTKTSLADSSTAKARRAGRAGLKQDPASRKETSGVLVRVPLKSNKASTTCTTQKKKRTIKPTQAKPAPLKHAPNQDQVHDDKSSATRKSNKETGSTKEVSESKVSACNPTKSNNNSSKETSKVSDPIVKAAPAPATVVKPKPTPMSAAFAAVTTAPHVDYDSDQEPPKEDTQVRFQWRGDPSVTLSDWTIEIVASETGQLDTYNIHKLVLSSGPRKSDYFLNLFCRGSVFRESESKTSRIELPELATKAFPQLLDFVYEIGDHNGALKIDTETAAALHFLGHYFQMRQLRWEAKTFWKKNLKLENATTYYEHAKLFFDDKISEAVADLFARNIMDVKPDSKITKIADATLWVRIVEKLADKTDAAAKTDAPGSTTATAASAAAASTTTGSTSDTTAASKANDVASKPSANPNSKPMPAMGDKVQIHLSELIAQFATDNQDDLDAATFQSLTAPESLRSISSKAALSLLKVEDAVVTNTEGSTALQDRCVAAMAANWKDVGASLTSDQGLATLKPPVLAKVVAKSLEYATTDFLKAEKDIEDMESSHETVTKQLQHDLEQKTNQLKDYRGMWSHALDRCDKFESQRDDADYKVMRMLTELDATVPDLEKIRTLATDTKKAPYGYDYM
ncbi:nervous system development [Seminavis robusta]|uniref:Nervous system development n=1 Tax=Seminavis robusta TaxID=568900 RepID=A0A9N8DVB4_9STRA|nr:nervous system development [Seminavis robusta]|eukprot:Sro384_g131560.1 nervous system development (729) ;mRNA; f:65158-67344